MTTTLTQKKYEELKNRIALYCDEPHRSSVAGSVMSILTTEKIIKVKEDTLPVEKKEPKSKDPNKGKYVFNESDLKLSCGCLYEMEGASEWSYCRFHSEEFSP